MNPNRPSSFTRCSALVWLLVFSLLLPGSWGCALFRDPVPPGFDTISIQVEVERDKKGSIEGDLAAYSTLKGVLVGIVTGVPSFGVLGGGIGLGAGFVTCAPTLFLYGVCVAVATIAGFVIGAAAGLLGGAAVGAVGGLPSKTAKEVTAVLARLEEGRSFEDDFRAVMREAIPREKQRDAADAAAVVTARLEEFDLRQYSKDRLSVRLWASMVQIWQSEGGKRQENTCKYRYTSEGKKAETWLADGGASFGEAITQGIETFARWMNRDLEAFATETELPETTEDPRSCFRERHWYSPFIF
jgi:hypothetical protein